MASESMKNLKQMMGQHGSESMKHALNKNADFISIRQMIEAQNAQMPLEPDVVFSETVLGEVKAERITSASVSKNGVIMFIHGGGFAFGSPSTVRSYTTVLAAETGMAVYSIDYRLAPEHLFPEGANDCFSAYAALVEKYPDAKIAVIGESAGGNLSIVTALIAKDKNIKLPACVIPISAVTDISKDYPSQEINKDSDLILPPEVKQLLRDVYLKDGQNPQHPYVSPMYGNLEGFPPMKIIVDKSEVLYDDSRLFAEKARNAGVVVEYSEYEDAFHSFPATGRFTEEGIQVLAETKAFILKYCR